VALAVQCAALVSLGRFPATDESFYKAAGREWARSGRFAAPELEGFTGTQPGLEDVFAAYPPVYPFLFGLAARAAGFSWRTCVAYDALIHAALVLTLAWLARGRLSAAPAALAAATAALALPLGTSGRPDELGLVFALIGLGVLEGPRATARRALLSGLAFGLAAGTSPPAAAMLGTLAVARQLERGALARMCAWGAAAAVGLALVLAPLLLTAPDAWRQFAGQSVLKERVGTWLLPLAGWRPAWPQVLLTAVLLAIGLAARTAGARAWARTWLVPWIALAAVAVTVPGKHTYLWMWGPWLLVAAAECIWRAWDDGRRRVAAACGGALVLAVGLAAAPALHRGLLIATLPPDQRPDAAAARVRALLPPGSRVLVDELWWSLADDHDVRDLYWSRPADLKSFEWLVLSGNGSGAPGRARALPPHCRGLESAFVVVRDDLNPRPASLFGLSLSRSAYGFGVRVLRRRAGSG
jgi:hypothetical protein